MSDYDDEPISYDDLEEQYHVEYESPLSGVAILDGVPSVGHDREEKLVSAILKAVSKEAGIKLSKGAFDMPFGDDDKSKGYIFVTLSSTAEAVQFQRALEGYAFDKKHTFRVVLFDQLERFETLEDEWTEPPKQEWAPREHLKAWLADDLGRDQFLTFAGDQVNVAWMTRTAAGATLAHERNRWTESYTTFSPLGTYLATVHAPGVALWGGSSFERLNRFAHLEVKLVDFSPLETYLTTWSPRPIEPYVPGQTAGPPTPFTEENAGDQVCIWHVPSGRLARSFPMIEAPPLPGAVEGAPKRVEWPQFKWSADEKYFARVTPGQKISVYESKDMGLLGKKSITVDGVADLEWIPAAGAEGKKDGIEHALAYWTPEVQNQPARVTLMALPARTILRSKNLFNVHDCKMHWQSAGDYLCVKVDRHTKTKKSQYCNLELFRLRDKDFPVQVVEIKDVVISFSWEPKGDRFVLITSNDPNAVGLTVGSTLRTSVTVYQFHPRKGDFRPIKTFEGKTCNTVIWSPKGRHFVLATLGSNSKFDLEFYDVELDKIEGIQGTAERDEKEYGNAIRLLATVEHFGMTEVTFDPSGRFVASYGSTWMTSLEPGWRIWDFKGLELATQPMDKFKQFLWRPRPPTLLSRDDQKRIRKNLREHARRFEELDAAEESNVSAELIATRKRLLEEWNAWRQRSRARVIQNRIDISEGKLSEEEARKSRREQIAEKATVAEQEVEEWVEEVLEEITEEVV